MWGGGGRFKMYLGSKIYKNGNTLSMRSEEKKDVKGYFWDERPFHVS